MAATGPRLPREEIARRGDELYLQTVRPTLRAEDDGKFVVIDVESGEFEVDSDDYTAVARLRRRVPDAQAWLVRVGHPAAHKLRGVL
jgi:hypothetical protein